MAQMADIVVKKADGTTNITYTALAPSSGDGVAAAWRAEAVSGVAGLRPTLVMSSKWNSARTVRRLDLTYQMPEIVTDSVTSTSSVRNRVSFTVSAAVPVGAPDTVISEAISQGFNLLVSTLILNSVKLGYAPT